MATWHVGKKDGNVRSECITQMDDERVAAKDCRALRIIENRVPM